MAKAVLAIDQGTTNSKAILISEQGEILARGSAPVGISHPQAAWVEQDAQDIWSSQLKAIQDCLDAAADVEIEAIGISNQRESVVAWDRKSGVPLGPVISWQCRRTADACARIAAAGHGAEVLARTGLPLDPMFPATKLTWLIENCAQGRGPQDLCLGTVDSWLIWNLSGGEVHTTDSSNAARTQLLNIESLSWDDTLLELFQIDAGFLPTVRDSSGVFARSRNLPGLPDGLPIAAAVGDSHAALFAQGAFEAGDGKVTFGTGSSIMATLPAFAPPPDGLTTTVAWSLSGKPTYAFEGNILVSASVFPWTADLLGLAGVDELMALAETIPGSEGVSLVPAHVGLGAPHWSTEARGLVSGLSFGHGPAHVARAAAESMALQVRDVFDAMGDSAAIGALFVDGGPTRNAFLMQLVANFLERPVTIRDAAEASALGAGFLAGLATGVWTDQQALKSVLSAAHVVEPEPQSHETRDTLAQWKSSVRRSLLS